MTRMSNKEEIESIIDGLRAELINVDSSFELSKIEFEKIRKNMESLKEQKAEIEKQIHFYRVQKKKVNKIKGKSLEVSDHAVVRFMKRVMGIDIDTLKKEIMKGEAPKRMPDGKYPLTHNDEKKYSVVVKNNVVVTVIAEEEPVL